MADQHPVTVRRAADYFVETDGRARTTVLTLIERLYKKGCLTRRRSGGVYEYSPHAEEGQVTQGLIRSFVHQVLGGSVVPLLQFLGTEAHLSEEELSQLRRLAGGLTGPDAAAHSEPEETDR